MLNDSYTVMWILWGLFFAVIEGQAILDKRHGDTLSEHVWKWIGKKGYEKPKWYKARRGVLGLGLLWLIAHFFFEV